MTFEEKAIEVLLLCKGNAQMAISDQWDRSDSGFESQIDICLDALRLANPALVHLTEKRLEREGIPPFYQEANDDA